jgi:hypothetical protein
MLACCCRPPSPSALLEGLADELIDLGQRPGSARPGRKLLTLVHAMQAGADKH